jgi:hypothetical protein
MLVEKRKLRRFMDAIVVRGVSFAFSFQFFFCLAAMFAEEVSGFAFGPI